MMRVMDGLIVTRLEIMDMFKQYEQARRQHAWWRRLLRWIHKQIFQRKKSIEDLSPEQRAQLRYQLDHLQEQAEDELDTKHAEQDAEREAEKDA